MTKKRKTDPVKLQNAISHYEGSKIPNVRKSSDKFRIGYETLRLALIRAGISTSRKDNAIKRGAPIKTENSFKNWSRDEDVILRDAVESGTDIKETCEVLGRTPSSIYARKHRLLIQGFIKENPSFESTRMKSDTSLPLKSEVASEEVLTEQKKSSSYEIDLNSLASLVKQFGISVKVSVQPNGTQVDMMP